MYQSEVNFITLLHEIFITHLPVFRDFEIRIFCTLNFHDFSQMLYCESLQFRIFEWTGIYFSWEIMLFETSPGLKKKDLFSSTELHE